MNWKDFLTGKETFKIRNVDLVDELIKIAILTVSVVLLSTMVLVIGVLIPIISAIINNFILIIILALMYPTYKLAKKHNK